MTDYDYIIDNMIFSMDESYFKISKFAWLSMLGMVSSEDAVILNFNPDNIDRNQINQWLTFAVCIKKYLGTKILEENEKQAKKCDFKN